MARTAKQLTQDSKVRKSIRQLSTLSQLKARFKEKGKKPKREARAPPQKRRYRTLSLVEKEALVLARYGEFNSSADVK